MGHGISKPDVRVSIADVVKLHIRTRHGTAKALENYNRAAFMWDSTMGALIEEDIIGCLCRAASRPTPNAKVATRLPSTDPQAIISIYVIHISGKTYIHAVD